MMKAPAMRLLRWSEKYTQTDMRYLASGGFWLFAGYGAQMAGGLVMAVALANLLPKDAYGTYQFIIAVSTIIGGFTLSGMTTALTRAVARGAEGTLPYAFRLQITWGAGIIVIAGAVASYYFLNGNALLGSAFLVTGACLPFLSGFSLYRPYLEGRQLFRESATLGMWRRPIPVVVVVGTLLLTSNPVLLVLAYYGSQTLSAALLYWRVVKKYPEPERADPELLNYSKHLSVMATVGLIANNVDDVILFHFLGPAAVAVYTLAQLPSLHFNKLFSLGGNLIIPKFSQRDFHTLKRGMGRKVALYEIACLGVVGAYILIAPFLFQFFFPAYHDAVLLSQVLAASLLFKPATLFSQVFAAHGMKRYQYYVQLSIAVVRIVLFIVFLPLFGLWGAAWAVLGTQVYWALITSTLFYLHKAQV